MARRLLRLVRRVAWPLSLALTTAGAWFLWRRPASYHEALIGFWLPSMALTLAGCWRGDRPALPSEPGPARSVISRRVLVPLTVAVLVVGAALRLWGAWSWPPRDGLAFEEAQLGGAAVSLLEHAAHPPEHRLPTYAIALSFAVLGPGIFAMRLPFMVMGALGPALLFAVGRKMASWEASLFAAALLAVSWWSIAESRFADEVVFPSVLQLGMVWLLLELVERRRAWAGALLGIACGAFLTEYTAYRLAPVMIFGYLAARFVVRIAALDLRTTGRFPWRSLRRELAGHLPGGTAMLLGVLPFAATAMVSRVRLGDGTFLEGFARHAHSPGSLFELPVASYLSLVAERAVRLVEMTGFPGRGALPPWTDSGGQPMLDVATAAVLALGLGLVAATVWRRLHAFVLSWLLVACGVFLAFPVNVNPVRYVTVLPVAFLVIALGGEVVWRAMPSLRSRRVLAVLGAVIVAWSAWANLSYFFGRLVRDPDVLESFRDPVAVTSAWIRRQPPGSLTWLITDICPELPSHPDTRWLLAGRDVRLAASPGACLPSPVAPKGPLLYLLLTRPTPPAFGDLVSRSYPNAEALPPIAIPHLGLWVFPVRVPGPRAASAASDDRAEGRFSISTFAARPEPPTTPGQPPAGARLLDSRREPIVSHLAIPERLRAPLPDGDDGAQRRLWTAASGELARPPEDACLRVVIRFGEAWVWLGGDLAAHLVRDPEQEQSQDELAATCPIPPGTGGVPLRLLYRHDGPELPGLQLSVVTADGQERLATAVVPRPGRAELGVPQPPLPAPVP